MITSGEEVECRTPERLDARLSVVAGVYVAALVAPTLVFVLVERLEVSNGALAVGTLCTAGVAIAAAVAWRVTHLGRTIVWLDRQWLAWLLPLAGVVPMVTHAFSVIEYPAYLLVDPNAAPVTGLVGLLGFGCGIVAVVLGDVLVTMARTRVADAMVDESAVDLEWTAGWTWVTQVRLLVGLVAVVGVLVALAVVSLGWTEAVVSRGALVAATMAFVVVVLATKAQAAPRTYRLTPEGLEQRRPNGARLFTPWTAIDGVTVADRSVVLHRRSIRPDIRFARRDVRLDDERIRTELGQYLE